MSGERDECRPVTLPSGEVVRVRGERPMDGRDAAALAEVVSAARRMFDAMPSDERQALADRQAAARKRIADRVAHANDDDHVHDWQVIWEYADGVAEKCSTCSELREDQFGGRS